MSPDLKALLTKATKRPLMAFPHGATLYLTAADTTVIAEFQKLADLALAVLAVNHFEELIDFANFAANEVYLDSERLAAEIQQRGNAILDHIEAAAKGKP